MEGSESQAARVPPEPPEKANPERDRMTHMRFAAEAGRMGIWDLDLRSSELSGSVLFSDEFGYDRPVPFTWDGLEQAIHPDDRQRWKAVLQQALANGPEYDIEYRVQRPHGGFAWLHVRARVSRAADGTPLRMAGISLDITERREAERRLELRLAPGTSTLIRTS
jgi:PAS domain S-box-containing protein